MSKQTPVGYKSPPKQTQFKKGKSGNPRGRPKGTKNLRTDLREELAEKITVTENGKQLEISKQRAMIKALMAKSIRGETPAARALINLIVGLEQADSQDKQPDELGANDLEILAAYRRRILKTKGEEGDSE